MTERGSRLVFLLLVDAMCSVACFGGGYGSDIFQALGKLGKG